MKRDAARARHVVPGRRIDGAATELLTDHPWIVIDAFTRATIRAKRADAAEWPNRRWPRGEAVRGGPVGSRRFRLDPGVAAFASGEAVGR